MLVILMLGGGIVGILLGALIVVCVRAYHEGKRSV